MRHDRGDAKHGHILSPHSQDQATDRDRQSQCEDERGYGETEKERFPMFFIYRCIYIHSHKPMDQLFSLLFHSCALPLSTTIWHLLWCWFIVYYMVFAFIVLLCSLVKTFWIWIEWYDLFENASVFYTEIAVMSSQVWHCRLSLTSL